MTIEKKLEKYLLTEARFKSIPKIGYKQAECCLVCSEFDSSEHAGIDAGFCRNEKVLNIMDYDDSDDLLDDGFVVGQAGVCKYFKA